MSVLVGTIPDFGGVVVVFSGFLAVPNGVLVDLGADVTISLGAMLGTWNAITVDVFKKVYLVKVRN